MLTKIISGGQTGADRAALDACLESGFPCGGYCPAGRLAEDGVIAAAYPVRELAGAGYPQRTRENVRISDGTAIFYESEPHGGTEQTLLFCAREGKPYRLIDISLCDVDSAAAALRRFISRHDLSTLNVAGPRQSACPDIHDFVRAAVRRLLSELTGD